MLVLLYNVQVYLSFLLQFPSWIFLFLPLQELEHQKKRPQELGDKFVSVVSQFITVASFSFSDVEDSLTEAKELVSHGGSVSLSLADACVESLHPISSWCSCSYMPF